MIHGEMKKIGGNTMKELAKNFDPSVVEERLYNKWMEKKYFHTEVDKTKEPFCIVMPPPEYYRAAAHGTCTGQHHAGYPDSLEKNGRLQRTLGTRH